MPKTLPITGVIASLLLLAACKSDEDVAPRRKFISFKMDDAVVLSEQTHRAYYAPGILTDTDPDNDHAELLITGYSYQKDVINIRVTTPLPAITPGVYRNTTPGTAMLMEMNPSFELITADDQFGELTVTIHELKDSVVVGQFNGTLVSLDDGSLKQIRDGYFKVVYRNYP
ncbi:hypothetical protein [Chitinophaga sp. XS-30]|uniref:hypothetical protein n=1 Tax=Chitinophaga sp. XS-30 TaxID=2604421 RepID=UPI0011DDCF8F|nr:hypothetical protein [Chitinophaga sp. XS-30]QEH40530.1 hypothetical protein FW415_06445 [Chitinophaga sp. XS-30]